MLPHLTRFLWWSQSQLLNLDPLRNGRRILGLAALNARVKISNGMHIHGLVLQSFEGKFASLKVAHFFVSTGSFQRGNDGVVRVKRSPMILLENPQPITGAHLFLVQYYTCKRRIFQVSKICCWILSIHVQIKRRLLCLNRTEYLNLQNIKVYHWFALYVGSWLISC